MSKTSIISFRIDDEKKELLKKELKDPKKRIEYLLNPSATYRDVFYKGIEAIERTNRIREIDEGELFNSPEIFKMKYRAEWDFESKEYYMFDKLDSFSRACLLFRTWVTPSDHR